MYDRSRKLNISGHIFTLLRCFGPGLLRPAAGLDENERKTHLLVYLRAILHHPWLCQPPLHQSVFRGRRQFRAEQARGNQPHVGHVG
jgi:hypothetical protein